MGPAILYSVVSAAQSPSPPHFTVVDDDSHTRFFIQRALVEAFPKSKIIAFEDGAIAFQYLRRNHTDCLVTDQSMREMNGDELLRRLNESGINIPTVMVSSSPNAEEAAASAGVVFLDKGRISSDLAKVVRALLQQKPE